MAKIKNIELKEKYSSLEKRKEGKVKKSKPKKDNERKSALCETDQKLDLTIVTANLKKPKNSGTGGIKIKDNNKSAEQEATQIPMKLIKKRASAKNKTEKQNHKKSVNGIHEQENVPAASPPKELTEADLKKIAKKKSKKLAQKLKKEQKKIAVHEHEDKKSATPTISCVQDTEISNTKAAINADVTGSKVLMKKGKKAQKRQLIKDQELNEKQTRDPTVEAATIFVGNLAVNSKRTHLLKLFKDFGPINYIRLRSAGGKILYKHSQRKTAGSLNAYIVFQQKETAEKALSLNGKEFKGNHLRVTLAANNSKGYEKEEKRTVFVGNLKYTATEESLHEIFSNCGEIEYVRCIREGDKGCKGVAYVCFKTPDAVGLALELNKTIVDERPINVERFSVKKLGAKKVRDAQDENEKNKKGAKLGPGIKKGKQKLLGNKKENPVDVREDKKPKKSEYRGVKVESLKKKQKLKKKKSNDQMLQLAKKIAPRT